MAAGRPKSIDDSKIFDVSKPGKSKPMGTSRPVIISRGNIIKDPTVNSEQTASPSSRKVISPVTMNPSPGEVPSSKIQVKVNGASKSLEESMTTAPAAPDTAIEIKNTAPEVKPDNNDQAKETEVLPAEETTSVEEKPAETTAEIETTPAPEETTAENQAETVTESPEVATDDKADTAEAAEPESDTPATSETATIDALSESTTLKKEEAKELELKAKRDAELQTLIDSGKYFVPLEHDSTAKKSRTGTWVLILLLLLIAAAYVVIDMKLIKTGINLPFHLFKQ